MTNPQFAGHPFGTTVTAETLRNTFAPLSQWEDKYRQLIMLGKQLPALPDELKAQAKEIAGCENRVWLGYTMAENGKMHFFGDSEGRIVRGLLAVTDFEYEMQIAQTNHIVEPNIDTMFFTTSLQYAYLSSTIAKEVACYGSDVSSFVTPNVARRMEEKFREKRGGAAR